VHTTPLCGGSRRSRPWADPAVQPPREEQIPRWLRPPGIAITVAAFTAKRIAHIYCTHSGRVWLPGRFNPTGCAARRQPPTAPPAGPPAPVHATLAQRPHGFKISPTASKCCGSVTDLMPSATVSPACFRRSNPVRPSYPESGQTSHYGTVVHWLPPSIRDTRFPENFLTIRT
jgi:hypothetical protein